MNLARRQKYANSGKTISKTDKTININFDLNVLNLMCSYVVSENRNVRRSHLINMRNLFELMDIGVYINDIEKMKRIDFIKKGIEARLIKNIKNPILIIKYINGGIIDENTFDISVLVSLSNEELSWIDETISESLKYAFIYNDMDRMIDICTRFKAADFISRGAIVNEFEVLINEIQTKFRKVRVESLSEVPFTLRNGAFEEVMADIHEKLTNPSSMLQTGMQGFNELTGGGLFSSRVYMLLGMTGVGKSLTLLDIALQIKKYNKHYIPKDPTKIPVVLYMTMENSVRETVQRLFTMSTSKDITKYSCDEVCDMLRKDGELYLSDDSPIDIIIKYVPDRSVDTGYLYTMVEDLEDEGYEVICLIQDHIKRIRSCYKQTDLRLELGAVVNEFKTFANIKDIPVITNSHLNRDGARTIDEGLKSNKADLTRMLGKANIGESMLMLDNLDCSFIINVEFDADGNKYMVFKRIKMRYQASSRDYICQPFKQNNAIKLVEDLYEALPLFRDSLKPRPDEVKLYNNVLDHQSKYQTIRDLDENIPDDLKDDNIFTSSRYNSMSTTRVDPNTIYPTCGNRQVVVDNVKTFNPIQRVEIENVG